MRFASLTTLASCSVILLMAACSSTPPAPVKAAAPAADSTRAASGSQAAAGGVRSADASAQGQAGRNGNAGAQSAAFDPRSASVYFEFDDSSVTSASQPLLQSQLKWMQDHPQQRVTLQGNADERGGAEYNLALGQRRADSVKKAIGLLGAKGDQIDTVSFGKEKPRAACHEESCWKENRRVDFAPAAQ